MVLDAWMTLVIIPSTCCEAILLIFRCILGITDSDTSLAVPSQCDLVSDKQMMQEKQPL